MTGEARITEYETESIGATRAYEAPQITVIGPLSKITLGSGGSKSDGVNKLRA